MAYSPSKHTASNKGYGVTGMPDSARYWFYDDGGTYTSRPYASIAEVLGYLIGEDRAGVTVQIGEVEYWWPNSEDLSDDALVIKHPPYTPPAPIVITIDAGETTPYTLTTEELDAINDLGRIPMFQALVADDSGYKVAYDILAVYTGSAGAYTQIDIYLHGDGGINLDDTQAQFI